MYQFPVKENLLDNHIIIADLTTQRANAPTKNEKKIQLRTYGLPYIFWGYFIIGLIVIVFMFLAIKPSIYKLYATQDFINQLISISVAILLFLIPFISLAFLFYEKIIEKNNATLSLKNKIFGIILSNKKYLITTDSIRIDNFTDSPNIAKIEKNKSISSALYENRGYFILKAISNTNQEITIDRSNKKDDLVQLKKLLEKY